MVKIVFPLVLQIQYIFTPNRDLKKWGQFKYGLSYQWTGPIVVSVLNYSQEGFYETPCSKTGRPLGTHQASCMIFRRDNKAWNYEYKQNTVKSTVRLVRQLDKTRSVTICGIFKKNQV